MRQTQIRKARRATRPAWEDDTDDLTEILTAAKEAARKEDENDGRD